MKVGERQRKREGILGALLIYGQTLNCSCSIRILSEREREKKRERERERERERDRYMARELNQTRHTNNRPLYPSIDLIHYQMVIVSQQDFILFILFIPTSTLKFSKFSDIQTLPLSMLFMCDMTTLIVFHYKVSMSYNDTILCLLTWSFRVSI